MTANTIDLITRNQQQVALREGIFLGARHLTTAPLPGARLMIALDLAANQKPRMPLLDDNDVIPFHVHLGISRGRSLNHEHLVASSPGHFKRRSAAVDHLRRQLTRR